ncbi:MAG: hypothetical protein KKB03_04320 [Nanoarchaeota archaeon]|nr:hypothetical protein [Nanoarchaeota archaeon]MBU1134951.1 hypothetical protein [Nanoarchaeota archaeon]MBU2520439.1 hypothetical protein [Nanoarchaeota archaeon]
MGSYKGKVIGVNCNEGLDLIEIDSLRDTYFENFPGKMKVELGNYVKIDIKTMREAICEDIAKTTIYAHNEETYQCLSSGKLSFSEESENRLIINVQVFEDSDFEEHLFDYIIETTVNPVKKKISA